MASHQKGIHEKQEESPEPILEGVVPERQASGPSTPFLIVQVERHLTMESFFNRRFSDSEATKSFASYSRKKNGQDCRLMSPNFELRVTSY